MELPQALRRKLAQLERHFVAETSSRIDALLAEVDASADRESLLTVRRAMHDLQGNGTTFGFPGITRIAEDAGAFARGLDELDAATAAVLRRHLEAIREILDKAEKADTSVPVTLAS